MANLFFLSIAKAIPHEAIRLGITVEAMADRLQAQQEEMDQNGTAGKYSTDRSTLKRKEGSNGEIQTNLCRSALVVQR